VNDTRPFAPGSVSVRLYPHNELDAPAIVEQLRTQAALAVQHGFDGVMVSEHHGGFSGYLPNPLQMAGFLLEAFEGAWAAPSPLLLPLRPPAMVAEEIAWLDARHPGRVGLGVGSGALELDFVEMGLRLEDAVPRFKAFLPKVSAMLRGEDLGGLAGDRALVRCAAQPIPVTTAAMSPAACRRAAACRIGILLEAMSNLDRQRELRDVYAAAGGTETVMLIRRVWVGPLPETVVAAQRAVYDSFSRAEVQQHFTGDQTIHSDDPADIAEQLAAAVEHVQADALNLRVHLPGVDAEQARHQITRLGTEVLPILRTRLAGRTTNPTGIQR
jgi:alkanesulfonate monooxygenase SsuD/methylene tetrahydromethanopterin reductase-like flavin-dependent oxidoreductase (luciferase family)